MIEEVAYKATDFSEQYFLLRQREGRIYSDDEVASLPQINGEHLYYAEWMIRKRSSDQLIQYLKNKNQPLHILEVGCGNGWLSSNLSTIPSVIVVGIDINKEELAQAKRVFQQYSNLEFFRSTLQDKSIDDKYFDVIVFAASIQYFPSLKSVLNDALQKLKTNGEIHILDSHFYKQREISQARQRSVAYFRAIGFPEMIDHYFHHSLDEIRQTNYKILYDPRSLFNRIKKNRNPFYWILVRQNA